MHTRRSHFQPLAIAQAIFHAASPVEQRPERLREVCSGQVRCGEGCARPSVRGPRLVAQQKSDNQGLRTHGGESGRDQCLGALRRRVPWNRRFTRVSGHRARSLQPRGAHGVRPQGRAGQRKWFGSSFAQVSGMANPARVGGGRSCERRTARVRAGGGRRRRPRPGRGGAGAGERLGHTRRSHFLPLALAQALFPPSSPNPDSIN